MLSWVFFMLTNRILSEVSPQVKRGWGARAGRRALRKESVERNRGGGVAYGDWMAGGGVGGGGGRGARAGHGGRRRGRRGGAGTNVARAPRRGGRPPREGAAASAGS